MSKPASLRRVEFILLFALITSLTALSIDAMLPALPAIANTFELENINDTQLILSLFVLGTVFGELVFGPISDAYGRRFAVIAGIIGYIAGTLLTIFAGSYLWLLLGRMLQGAGVAGSRIGSRALVRDLYQGEEMARVMSFIMTIFILIPMVAPAMGQVVLNIWGWQAIFVSFLLMGLLVLCWFSIRQRETLIPEKRIPLSLSNIVSCTKQIVKHGKVMSYTFVSGLVFGVMIVYLSTSQDMFASLYGRAEQFPLYFALLAFGVGIAALVNGKLVMRFGMQVISRTALLVVFVFSFILLVFTYLGQGVPIFASFVGCLFMILFGVGFVFGNINAMSMQWLGGMAGVGASVVGAVSSTTAVLFSLLVGRTYDGSLYPLSIAFIAVALICLGLLRVARNAPAKHL